MGGSSFRIFAFGDPLTHPKILWPQ